MCNSGRIYKQLVLGLGLGGFALVACGDEESEVEAQDVGQERDGDSGPSRDLGILEDSIDLIDAADGADGSGEEDGSGGDASDGSAEADAADGSGETDGSATTCESDCPRVGATQCLAGGVQTCALDSESGCLLWQESVPCGADQRCEEGACVDGACQDACLFSGQTCAAEGGIVNACLDADGDGCKELSQVDVCEAGTERCDGGRCIATSCPGGCEAGSTQCQGNEGFQVCGDFDNNGCLEFGGPVTPCEGADVCFAGACGENVPRECLLISEYYEADGNNKAIEVHNCGNVVLSLSNVYFCQRNNSLLSGCTAPTLELSDAADDLEPGATLTVANRSAGSAVKNRSNATVTNFPTFSGDDRIILFRDANGNVRVDPGEILDSFGDPDRAVSGDPFQDTVFRRCSTEAHLTGPFVATDYYTEHAAGDVSNLGVAPTYAGCD